ncbi:MAG: hypothetical protein M9949_04925 [Candidatus Kapabacteria bacterium]|nr:hypothetical protein [Candidatus Kapabacteria bacterium]
MSLTAKDLKSNCIYEMQGIDFTEYIKIKSNENETLTFYYLNNEPSLIHTTGRHVFDAVYKINHELAPVESSDDRGEVSILLSALEDIRNWNDDLDDEWDDVGQRAQVALNVYKHYLESNNGQAKYRYLVTGECDEPTYYTTLPRIDTLQPPWELIDLQENKYTTNGKRWLDIEIAEGESVK